VLPIKTLYLQGSKELKTQMLILR